MYNAVFIREDIMHNGKNVFISEDGARAFWYCKNARWMMGDRAGMVKEFGWILGEIASKTENSSPHLTSKWLQLQGSKWRPSQIKVRIQEKDKPVGGAFGPETLSCMSQKRKVDFVSVQDNLNSPRKKSQVRIDFRS